MFTILSIILYISILMNGNLSNNAAAYMLVFGWILFLGVGIILDGILILALTVLIILIVIGIILLVRRLRLKKKEVLEEKEYKEVNEKNYGGKSNGE